MPPIRSSECSICISKLRKNNHVICHNCSFVSCKPCLKQFFEDQDFPKCPNCRLIWTQEVVSGHFKGYQKQFNQFKAKQYLEREIALLPETQPLAERFKVIEELTHRAITPEEKQAALDARMEYQNHIRMLINQEGEMQAEPQTSRAIKCPKDDCNGFILEGKNECGICGVGFCLECNTEIGGDAHECKKDDLETARLIRQDTRGCPKCSALISKIDGCDQMWCTQCKTAFSWRTGKIEEGRVHNPHFYEWQRQVFNGDIPRVDEDQHQYYGCALRFPKKFDPEAGPLLDYLFKPLANFVTVQRQILQEPIRPNNVDLRIDYLLKRITKPKLSQSVFRRIQKFRKLLEFYQLRIALFDGLVRVYWQLARYGKESLSYSRACKCAKIVIQSLQWFNKSMIEIASKYNSRAVKLVYAWNGIFDENQVILSWKTEKILKRIKAVRSAEFEFLEY